MLSKINVFRQKSEKAVAILKNLKKANIFLSQNTFFIIFLTFLRKKFSGNFFDLGKNFFQKKIFFLKSIFSIKIGKIEKAIAILKNLNEW